MVLKRYKLSIIGVLAIAVLYFFDKEVGGRALISTGNSLIDMMIIVPPVFIILGLLDTWIPKETTIKYLGNKSGIKGIAVSFFMGAVSAGPLYGAFPIASVLMKKGAKFSNIIIFIGAWSTTKVPMFLFELEALGVRFALSRLVIDIVGIVIIAKIITRFVGEDERKLIYAEAEKMVS
ncbi:MAG: permease [Candidatus Cloacimonadota bacterium]|nr:MAG: permease [Candidatus Cloacimonadota bacterium]PIE77431.1 MAG: permease [Candidatus Delongbacteria bacterium]